MKITLSTREINTIEVIINSIGVELKNCENVIMGLGEDESVVFPKVDMEKEFKYYIKPSKDDKEAYEEYLKVVEKDAKPLLYVTKSIDGYEVYIDEGFFCDVTAEYSNVIEMILENIANSVYMVRCMMNTCVRVIKSEYSKQIESVCNLFKFNKKGGRQ